MYPRGTIFRLREHMQCMSVVAWARRCRWRSCPRFWGRIPALQVRAETHFPHMNQHINTRTSASRILFSVPVVGMLSSLALAGGVAQPAPYASGWGTAAVAGMNDYGQTDIPADLGRVIQVAVGRRNGVALQSGGTVRAWGFNAYGYADVPVDLGTVIQVASGDYHALAVQSGGTVRAWGYGGFGQLDVPGDLGTVIQVAAGEHHSLALQSDGTLRAWGSNSEGQTTVPSDLGTAVQVAAAYRRTLAVNSAGTVRAWGFGAFGENTVPGDLGTVIQVASGMYHNVALQSDGTVRVWGVNGSGQLTIPGDLGPVVQVAAGAYHSVALQSDGAARAWGSYETGVAVSVPPVSGVVTQIGVGAGSFIAVISAGADELASHITDQVTALSACEAEAAVVTTQNAPLARGDVDNDGAVGQQDLQQMLRHWGPNSAAENTGDLKQISRSVKAALKAIKQSRRVR